MKNLLVLISLGCLLNGATLLQDTVSALVDETASLRIEVKTLKDKIKILNSDNLETLNVDSNITAEQLTLVIKDSVVKVNKTNTYNIKKLEFADVMIFVWHANVRKAPVKESLIMGVYDIGSLHSVDTAYTNDNWFKLSNGYYLSKKVAQPIDKDLFNEVITLDTKNNLRRFPVAKKEYLKSVLQRNTVLLVYPKKVADIWYVTQDHEFIYDKLVKNHE